MQSRTPVPVTGASQVVVSVARCAARGEPSLTRNGEEKKLWRRRPVKAERDTSKAFVLRRLGAEEERTGAGGPVSVSRNSKKLRLSRKPRKAPQQLRYTKKNGSDSNNGQDIGDVPEIRNKGSILIGRV